MNHKTRIVTLVVFLAGAIGYIASAGPLDPPPGPVAPTQKTLSEVEPRIAVNATNTPGDDDSLFKITQPGSYYLTGNITGVASKMGIEIAASGVTLDLMGFDLVGVSDSLDGVRASVDAVTDIAVINGSVRDWGGRGVDLLQARNTRITDLRASGNAVDGIRAGVNGVITNCSVSRNSANGLIVGAGSTISQCSAYLNSSGGIVADAGSTISQCSAAGNLGTGIFAERGSTIASCSAVSNTNSGINTTFGSTIVHCSARNNAGSGIQANSANTIANCTANSNSVDGISGDGNTITDCLTRYNTGNGISVFSGSRISSCSAGYNGGNGIEAFFTTTIANCLAEANTADGIRVDNDCTIRGNSCHSNGAGAGNGAGIHATGADNRIEGNNCTNADRGIDVDLAGNFITRNTCEGNTTNWDVAAGNVILVVNATTAGAVSGSSGGTAPGSTDPNANFTY